MNSPYLPHTNEDINSMLETIGKSSVDSLFADIPDQIKLKKGLNIPSANSEIEIKNELYNISKQNYNANDYVSFLGAGAYDHYIPSVVKHLANRSEFYTSYTPYQAEISQGTLQIYFEYQTMICALTKMDVSNASMYDGATSLAEAVLMAHNTNNRKKVILPKNVHPEYREVVKTYVKNTGIEIIETDFKDGIIDIERLKTDITDEVGSVVVQQPNFLGCIENVFEIEKIAHENGAVFIACVDPVSLGILIAPGDYNADIVVGEGQSLGNEMNFGGPYLGFFAAKNAYVRKMPGRIIGETKDKDGKRAFTLTLQTREQHIRREKATSNICSNEALCAISAAIYLSCLGKKGVREIAVQCLQKSHYAKEKICRISGFKEKYSAPFFKEFVVETPFSLDLINKKLFENNILNLLDLGVYYPELKNNLLICVTEKRTKDEIDRLVNALKEIK